MAERPPNEPVETDDGHSHEADRRGEDVEIAAFGRLTDRRSQSGRRQGPAAILHVFGDDAGVHAPPIAVIQPVRRLGKMAGRMSFRQRWLHENRANRDTSHSSRGIALLPAMTLNRIYHCVPSNSSTTELIPRPTPNISIPPTTTGKIMGAGKLAAIWISG